MKIEESMDDWEVEIPSLVIMSQTKIKWGDEDVDDDLDVKESWEDDHEEQAASKAIEKAKTTAAVAKEPPHHPMFHQKRVIEQSENGPNSKQFGKELCEKNVDNFIPKSETDFAEYAELISHKLLPYKNNYHYKSLLKAVMRLSLTCLKAADAKDIASSITTIVNEKIKSEKQNITKKKTGSKKKWVKMDKRDDFYVDAYGYGDDDDFM